MTPDENKQHAYMPAIMGCASFIELFSGLFSGNVSDPVGIANIICFTKRFLDKSEFTEERICLFFSMFRHKVAHVSRPYSVFDSHDVHNNNPLKNYPKRRITWYITATYKKPAIEIIAKNGELKKDRRPPWKQAPYSHICQINLKRMIKVFPNAVTGPKGYLNEIMCCQSVRNDFIKCMDSFYP